MTEERNYVRCTIFRPLTTGPPVAAPHAANCVQLFATAALVCRLASAAQKTYTEREVTQDEAC
jgi:hypothetical protein